MDVDRYPEFMQEALREAAIAFDDDEVPVGAVVVFEGRIIGRGHNQVESLHDATAHAEIIALSAAYNHFGDWRLENCLLFSSLELCPMCAGAAMLSRIKTIVYGAADPKFGACGSIINIAGENRFNHNAELVGGVLSEEAGELMKMFFEKVRQKSRTVN